MTRNAILENFGKKPDTTVDVAKEPLLQQNDCDTWPDGWGRTGRHPTFALQLIQRQADNSAKTTAIIYGSICSEILFENDTITFVYETYEGLHRVTITGKDLNEPLEMDGRRFSSVFDQVAESKRISIRENAPHVERIEITKVEEKEGT